MGDDISELLLDLQVVASLLFSSLLDDELGLDELEYLLAVQTQPSHDRPAEASQFDDLLAMTLKLLFQLAQPVLVNSLLA